MYNDETAYRIELEDYSYPRHTSKLKAYFGTKTEIMKLISGLSADPDTALRYHETIEAVDRHTLDPEGIHHMAGQERRILEPVRMIANREISVINPSWLHNGYTNAKVFVKAASLNIQQLLVECEGNLTRCAKFRFDNLMVCVPGVGWISPGPHIRGFPGMFCWMHPNIHHSILYTQMETYSHEALIQAVRDTNQLKEWDYEILCDDILGVV